ncbi:unnamed protein product [Brassica oleracea]
MAPYPIRPNFFFWYICSDNKFFLYSRNEEYLEPLSLPIEEDYLGKQEVTKLFCGKKKTF